MIVQFFDSKIVLQFCTVLLYCRTKDGVRISSPRMFVFPEDYNVGQLLVKRGSLLIINALQEDSGKYECHTVVKGADFTEEKITSIYQVCNTLNYLILISFSLSFK